MTLMSKTELLKIKAALEANLPNSLQLFNIIQQILAGDGIERDVYVNEDFSHKDLAVMVLEKVELPKQVFSVFCTKNSLEKLKKIVDERLDWTKFNQFDVRFTFYLVFKYLKKNCYQGVDEEQHKMLKNCVPDGTNVTWNSSGVSL